MENEQEKIDKLMGILGELKKECEEILSKLPDDDEDDSEEVEFDPDTATDAIAYEHYINDYDEDVVLLYLLLKEYEDGFDIDDISSCKYSCYLFDVGNRQYYFGTLDQMRSLAEDQCRDSLHEMYSVSPDDFLYNYIDFDQAAEDAVDYDGIANTLASYDGEELSFIYGGDGYYAYRVN